MNPMNPPSFGIITQSPSGQVSQTAKISHTLQLENEPKLPTRAEINQARVRYRRELREKLNPEISSPNSNKKATGKSEVKHTERIYQQHLKSLKVQ